MPIYTRKGTSSIDLLERILTRTTLTTQRLGHDHILDLGGKLLDCKSEDVKEDHNKDVQEAIEAAEARATRELRASMKRLRKELEHEKQVTLETQKQYYLRHMERAFAQRDLADAERTREMTKQFDDEKSRALTAQRASMLKEREEAIKMALQDLRKIIDEEMKPVIHAEREEAAKIARELAEMEAVNGIENARGEWNDRKKEEIAQLILKHSEEVAKLNCSLEAWEGKYRQEAARREKVETDFELLQEDYARFLNFTDGRFHSDYMIKPRSYGRGIADRSKTDPLKLFTSSLDKQSVFVVKM